MGENILREGEMNSDDKVELSEATLEAALIEIQELAERGRRQDKSACEAVLGMSPPYSHDWIEILKMFKTTEGEKNVSKKKGS
jgi:hypothetical protein